MHGVGGSALPQWFLEKQASPNYWANWLLTATWTYRAAVCTWAGATCAPRSLPAPRGRARHAQADHLFQVCRGSSVLIFKFKNQNDSCATVVHKAHILICGAHEAIEEHPPRKPYRIIVNHLKNSEDQELLMKKCVKAKLSPTGQMQSGVPHTAAGLGATISGPWRARSLVAAQWRHSSVSRHT